MVKCSSILIIYSGIGTVVAVVALCATLFSCATCGEIFSTWVYAAQHDLYTSTLLPHHP